MTQTSVEFLALQSTPCWRTNIEPESRCTRGAVFWADSEARVQIAPSGMMKKRKDGLIIFELLFCRVLCGVGDCVYSQRVFPPDVVECFICFVVLRVPGLGICRQNTHNSLNSLQFALRSQAVDAGDPEQLGELLAGIEHPGLHRALRDPDDRADLFHRLLMVVDEVDDLAMRRRQLGDAGAQDRAGGCAVERGFG